MLRIIVDFEIAINFAIANMWSTIEIKGFHFIFDQSWWRKIQEIRLSAKYNDQPSERKFLKIIFVCYFLIQMK
jgi:hypothetical protein